jgi:hypothetical protein
MSREGKNCFNIECKKAKFHTTFIGAPGDGTMDSTKK